MNPCHIILTASTSVFAKFENIKLKFEILILQKMVMYVSTQLYNDINSFNGSVILYRCKSVICQYT